MDQQKYDFCKEGKITSVRALCKIDPYKYDFFLTEESSCMYK